MAIAGKVAITLSTENGGAWSADVTYDRLVAVKHNNNLYISRKTVANVEPPNDEFWFLALEGFSGDDIESILQAIENIINGTQQVGDAKTLDGHGAEFFATAEELKTINGSKELRTSILETALSLGVGVYEYTLSGSSYSGGDLPNISYAYGNATIYKRSTNSIAVILRGVNSYPYPCFNFYNGTSWTGWIADFTTAGGTVNGDALFQKESNSLLYIALKNALRQINVEVQQGGIFRLRDTTNGKDIIISTVDGTTIVDGTASGNLPIKGGTLTGARDTLLVLDTSTVQNLVRFATSGETKGYIGFNDTNPVIKCGSKSFTTLLHTGNKPTGTYTGNGDATQRTIQTNGIGSVFYVRNVTDRADNKYSCAIVMSNGYIGKDENGNFVSGTEAFTGANASLVIKSTSPMFNKSGVSYEYGVL